MEFKTMGSFVYFSPHLLGMVCFTGNSAYMYRVIILSILERCPFIEG